MSDSPSHRSLPPSGMGLQDGALQPGEDELPAESLPASVWRTLLLESLPPDERVAIVGLMILLCVSLTGGAFLGSMLISVIVFAR